MLGFVGTRTLDATLIIERRNMRGKEVDQMKRKRRCRGPSRFAFYTILGTACLILFLILLFFFNIWSRPSIAITRVRFNETSSASSEMRWWTKLQTVQNIGGCKFFDAEFAKVGVRIYCCECDEKHNSKTLPALLYFHGGGWVHGDVDELGYTLTLARTLYDILVISVNYRLAPRYPFPIPFQDCVDATEFLLNNSRTMFGVDPYRIAVAGHSAGGNLAAAVALKLRNRHGPRIRAQILLAPVLQGIDLLTPSYQSDVRARHGMSLYLALYSAGKDTNAASIATNNHTSAAIKKNYSRTFLDHNLVPSQWQNVNYVKPSLDFGNEQVWMQIKNVFLNPYFAPLLAEDLSQSPTALIVTCQNDVLRDEAIMYVKRLRDTGIEVQHAHSPTSPHTIPVSVLVNSIDPNAMTPRDTLEVISNFLHLHLSH